MSHVTASPGPKTEPRRAQQSFGKYLRSKRKGEANTSGLVLEFTVSSRGEGAQAPLRCKILHNKMRFSGFAELGSLPSLLTLQPHYVLAWYCHPPTPCLHG